MAPQMPRGLWTAAVMVTLVVLSTPVAEGRDSPQDFVFQLKGLCYFTNGTERVRLVARYLYNREEWVRFDSDVGEFRAVTELGRPDAEYLNGQKDVLEQYRAYVDTLCRHNYQGEALTTLQRQAPPPARCVRFQVLTVRLSGTLCRAPSLLPACRPAVGSPCLALVQSSWGCEA